MSAQPSPIRPVTRSTDLSRTARRRPMTFFLVLVFGIGWPVLAVPAVAGLPFEPFKLVLIFGVMLPSALLVTRLADGPGAVRRLLSRLLIWRVGATRWAVVLLGMPLLTLAVAAVSGTLETPESGWLSAAGLYLFQTLVWGALLINLWEEATWGGFAQSRLMARHGLLVGALLTAPMFAAIHVPLQFAAGWTWSSALTGVGLVALSAVLMRYLLGMHLLDTRGSILLIGVQHAAFNASASLDGVQGWWQYLVALGILTGLVAAARRVYRPESRPTGRAAEMAAASTWLSPRPSAATGHGSPAQAARPTTV